MLSAPAFGGVVRGHLHGGGGQAVRVAGVERGYVRLAGLVEVC